MCESHAISAACKQKGSKLLCRYDSTVFDLLDRALSRSLSVSRLVAYDTTRDKPVYEHGVCCHSHRAGLFLISAVEPQVLDSLDFDKAAHSSRGAGGRAKGRVILTP